MPSHLPAVTIVMPLLNEADALRQGAIEACAQQEPDEIILVDGGSDDGTVEIVSDLARAGAASGSVTPAIRMLRARRSRASQMNAGAAVARGDVLVFLHADTRLPPDGLALVRDVTAHGALWGRFDVRLSGGKSAFRVIEWLMNLRSMGSGIATGDQAMFVRKDVFRLVGGFRSIALMEDIELCRRLGWISRPERIAARVVTSSRRWEQHGIAGTVLRMWILRTLYWLGVSPQRLARWYR